MNFLPWGNEQQYKHFALNSEGTCKYVSKLFALFAIIDKHLRSGESYKILLKVVVTCLNVLAVFDVRFKEHK